MANKDKDATEPLPLHKALPDMITDTAIRNDVAGFLRLLKIVEQVKIPDNHAEIMQSIHEGWNTIKDDLECQVMMAKATMDMAIYKRDMDQSAQDEVDFADDEERRKEQQDEAELEKIEANHHSIGEIAQEDPHKYYPTKHPWSYGSERTICS